ncbi:cyclic lactone autoinducer peptide [Clostridium botulinum]|uniref:Cyclic lactone autoinducer peptide n=1 Tax=Clostridium botulinum TaxID=1491 RepID=A0AAU8YT29_CLOBO|nr:cyclic lactone autoinducer peptide [Clostridium sporogenes]AVP62796.1 cyclic lactone autoinducer peptide [Clostridium botulinum]MCF4018491.1 cyclic lactone autoinducer peptide [Clostridium sporogenes]MCW6062355.1 cyclic lactone autoinducer peptide [Clostridium sporogenes]MCW6069746.1 cyclic lactone autoinducer peptide [Clostridium sporogenes]NFG04269.1 cyclic lactone autoinducer peptide [Clostridium sporogenes]
MKKQLKEKCIKVTAKLLKSVAYSTADSACVYGLYQPKEPKSLRK